MARRDRVKWRRLWPFVRPHRRILIFTICMVPILSGLNLLQPYLVKVAIDSHILKGDWSGLKKIALIYLFLFSTEYVLNFIQTYIMQLTGQKVVYDLRKALFEKIQNLQARYFDRTPMGITLTRVTSDCEAISDFFASGIVSLGWDLFRLVFTVVAMVLLDWRLTLVTFSVLPILLTMVVILRRLMLAGYNRVREKLAELNVFVQEHLNGMRVVQLFRQEKRCQKEFEVLNEAYRDINMTTVRYDAVLYAVVEALSSVAVGLIIWYGGGNMVRGVLTFGVLVAFIEYIQRFFIPIRDLSSKFAIIQATRAALEKVFSLLDHPVSIVEMPGAQDAPRQPNRVSIRGVSFEYRDQQPVLQDLNIEIQKGEKVALVGVTGSGKSTLFKVMNRTHDVTKGAIEIDGVNIKEFSLASLRRLFAVVPQDVFLFNGSILENIRLFDSRYTSQEVVRAAEHAGAAELIRRVEGGYGFQVFQRGSNLSLGQRQLIAMARGVLFDAPILFLDEATAHVDPMTTRLLHDGLQKISQNRTVIVAAHRLSTIRDMDRILVLHHGRLCESGSHEDLLQSGGIYAQLCLHELEAA